MIVTAIEDIVNEDILVRQYFQEEKSRRDKALEDHVNFHENKSTLVPEIINNCPKNEALNHGKFKLVANQEKFPMIVRDKKHLKMRMFTCICTYSINYLRNSIVSNYLLSDNIDSVHGAKIAHFLLSYYWFISDIPDFEHYIVVDLEETVKLLITKEMTLYKEKNTRVPVNHLRTIIKSLKLASPGIQVLNLRG